MLSGLVLTTTAMLAGPASAGMTGTKVEFSGATNFTIGAGLPWSVRTADFNNDGKPDIVTANAGQLGWNGVSVLLNATPRGAGAPVFGKPANLNAGWATTGVAAADFNGDGKADIAAANTGSVYFNAVSVFTNKTPDGATTAGFGEARQFAGGLGASQIAAADMNGDGKPDIIVGNFASPFVTGVSVLINTTQRGAQQPSFAGPEFFTEGWGSEGIGVGDLNGDGKPDVVIGNTISSQVSVLFNTTKPGAGKPSFAPVKQIFSPLATAIGLADFNGDGKLDIAAASTVSTPGAGVYVWTNNTPVGSLEPKFDNKRAFGTGFLAEDIAVADYNGDGKPDLAVANDVSVPGLIEGVSVLVNTTPAGSPDIDFAKQQLLSTGGIGTNTIATADFTGDGKPDLTTGNVVTLVGKDGVSVLVNQTN